MNNKIRQQFIQDLNIVVNRYVENCNLFKGGCCYSAYVLAKYLKMMGISYKTVVFQDCQNLNCNRFHTALNGGVAHVAILVTYKNMKVYIGTPADLMKFYRRTKVEHRIRKYRNITPEEILKSYRDNMWNDWYDTHCNGPLMRDIKRVYMKYAEI